MMDRDEHLVISAYSKAEMVGGIMLASIARITKDNKMRAALTKHAAEEMNHALYIVETLEKLGLEILEVHDEDKKQYYALAGTPKDEVQMMAFTSALEPIAIHQYNAHIATPGTNPEIADTLKKMNEEDDDHKDWVVDWLGAHEDQAYVKECVEKYRKFCAASYNGELDRWESLGGRMAEIAATARKMPKREDAWW